MIFEQEFTGFAIECTRGDNDLGRIRNHSIDVHDLEFDQAFRVFTDDLVSEVLRWRGPQHSRKAIGLRYLWIDMLENLTLDRHIAGLLTFLCQLRIGFGDWLRRVL